MMMLSANLLKLRKETPAHWRSHTGLVLYYCLLAAGFSQLLSISNQADHLTT